MAIDAVFLHDDGYKYNLIYSTKNKFLASLKRLRNAVFVDAVDYDIQYVIRPSNLPDYRAQRANR
jgi:hypothetical protein